MKAILVVDVACGRQLYNLFASKIPFYSKRNFIISIFFVFSHVYRMIHDMEIQKRGRKTINLSVFRFGRNVYFRTKTIQMLQILNILYSAMWQVFFIIKMGICKIYFKTDFIRLDRISWDINHQLFSAICFEKRFTGRWLFKSNVLQDKILSLLNTSVS